MEYMYERKFATMTKVLERYRHRWNLRIVLEC